MAAPTARRGGRGTEPAITEMEPGVGSLRSSSPSLRYAVEEFLYRDATLLDTWRLDAWLATFTDDCQYLVPSPDRPLGDPSEEMFLVQDDRFLLEQRVDSLLTKTAWAESPHSTTRRLVTNVRAIASDDGTVHATANFLITRARRDTVDTYSGHYELRLVDRASAAGPQRLGRAGADRRHRPQPIPARGAQGDAVTRRAPAPRPGERDPLASEPTGRGSGMG